MVCEAVTRGMLDNSLLISAAAATIFKFLFTIVFVDANYAAIFFRIVGKFLNVRQRKVTQNILQS